MATNRDAAVPDPDHPKIVVNDLFGGEPRISGRRITVLDVYDQVEEGDGDLAPDEFAERFHLPVADVYAALAYYHAHEDEMERHRAAREQASEELRERVDRDRPDGINPDE